MVDATVEVPGTPVPLVPGPSDKAALEAQQKALALPDPNKPTPDASLKAKEDADKAKLVEAAAAEKKTKDDEAAALKKLEDAKNIPDEYVKLSDPAGQAAINLLQKAGVTPAQASVIFQEAIDSKDFTKIKWDQLDKLVGKDEAVLIKAGVEQYYNTTFTENQKVANYAFETYGGETGWAKVKDWATTIEKHPKATTETKAEIQSIRDAISAGGYAARLALDKLKGLYESDPKNSTLLIKQTKGDTAHPVLLGDPLSRNDYLNEKKKLYAKGASSSELAMLEARRGEGRKRGI